MIKFIYSIATGLLFLIVLSLLINTYREVYDNNIQNAFLASIFFWLIIDYAFKAMVIDKIKGEK